MPNRWMNNRITSYNVCYTKLLRSEGKVVTWNRAMEQLTGIAAADMVGKGSYEYALPFYGERRPILISYNFV